MEANDIPVDKAVRMYVKVREAKRELSQRFKEEEEALNEDLDQLDAISSTAKSVDATLLRIGLLLIKS